VTPLRELTGFAGAALSEEFTNDRDINAAKNIKAAGQADFNDRGAQVRPGLVPAPRGEAVTHPDAARSTRSLEGISVPHQGGEDVKVRH
jgi:putative transposase